MPEYKELMPENTVVAVCSLAQVAGDKPGVKIDDYWEVGKAQLQDPTKFLDSLFKYDKVWRTVEWYKWKNHFYEMKGNVGMSRHEKERNKRMLTPRQKVIHKRIPTSLLF